MQINWIGELLDTAFSLSGKYARWLNIKGKRVCFIIWTVCIAYWAVRDFYLELYSQGIFCLFSMVLNIYGYYNWKKNKVGE